MNGYFHLSRISWNETASDSTEEYKTYMVGAAIVGMPQFLYGRTPFASWGVTALNPDVTDLWVEEINEDDGTYFDALTGKYEPFVVMRETFKVRFGSDVIVDYKMTRNGIIMPENLLDESAGQAMPWISQEAIKGLGPGKAYSIAWILDTAI